ncbi:MAG: diguanylate cyclase [Anaerolineaceae bacterium]|nr:diguanylate cyclase [Anaerolineaceae bacterium]
MNLPGWDTEFPAAITICDPEGIVLRMNQRAAQAYAQDGGLALIGSSALNCHPEPARTKMLEMLKSREKNIYTIEKNGVKKMVYHSPWYQDGHYAGFVELLLEIPSDVPHFIRE